MSELAEIHDFLSYVSSERALSNNTRLAYEADLDQFVLFCLQKSINPLVVTLKDLRLYLASMRRRGLSARSMARKLSALKQFYKFLLRENRVGSDPAELLSVSVKGKNLPKHLSVEEIFRLIASATGTTDLEIRDRALLEFWYATGARVSEMSDLVAQNIDWKDGVVKIRGKGGRERLVPLSQSALEWGKKYQSIRHEWVRAHNLKETDLFFLTLQGRRFSRQGVWKLLKRYAEKAKIGRNVWPHLIRHTFATHVLAGGADLRSVQELLGHRSIATTEIYTHLDIENLKVMQLKYHPRG